MRTRSTPSVRRGVQFNDEDLERVRPLRLNMEGASETVMSHPTDPLAPPSASSSSAPERALPETPQGTPMPREKEQSRMQLDTPSPSMAGPMRDLSRTMPARSQVTYLTPMRESLLRFEARLRELEQSGSQTVDVTSFSAAEQAMQNEIAHLTQQLHATQLHLPQAVRQQVSATQAQQSAQMNMLAHGLTQVHHMVQNAQASSQCVISREPDTSGAARPLYGCRVTRTGHNILVPRMWSTGCGTASHSR